MRIQINGEEKNFPDNLKLLELVEQLGLKADRLAIELNREVVSRSRWGEIQIHDGDKLEIVHFVGGGRGRGIVEPEGLSTRTEQTGEIRLFLHELARPHST